MNISCQENTVVEDDVLKSRSTTTRMEADPIEFSVENDKALIADLGYDTLKLVEYPSYYMVDDEFIFFKSKMHEFQQQPQTRMKTNGVVKEEYRRIHLNIMCFDAEGQDVLLQAIEAWNNIGNCSIHFSNSIYDQNTHNRPITHVEIGQNPSGRTELLVIEAGLDAGMPGSTFWVNTAHSSWVSASSDQKKYLMMHALGHMVLLKNTTELGSEYPGTSNDPQSIMQDEKKLSPSNPFLWNGFTSSDISALRIIYPLAAPVSTITCQPLATGSNKNEVKASTQYTISVEYNYAWAVDPTYTFMVLNADTVCPITGVQSNLFKITFPKGGNYKLTVTVNEKYGEVYTYDKTFVCSMVKPVLEAPSSIEIGTSYDFKVVYSDPQYNPTFTFSAQESLFDNNDGRSVTVVRSSIRR